MELQFTISSEQNVREAFAIWAWENGYEILESGEECPDLRVRKPDGEIEGFEVEKLASNFHDHGHDPDDADRIVCWRNDLGTEAPLPVIQLETHIDASDSLHTPRYVLSENGGGKHDWINQFLVWEEGDTPYLTFRYYGEDDGSWQLKSSAVPNLSGEEFASIFGQIPVDIRREAFCNASFQTLRGYVEDEFDDRAFEDGIDRSADVGTYHRKDGTTVSFGVMSSKPCFAIRAFNDSGVYLSRGAAQLHSGDYPSFFEGVSEDISEALFINLDLETAVEMAKEQQLPTAKQRNPNS